MRRIGLAILGVIGLATSGVLLPVTHIRHTCVICRLGRVRSEYLVLPITTYRETDCSRWYSAHVEPRHEHLWEHSVCTYTTNLFGMPSSVGCSPGRFPIWTLGPSTQMRAYQHFKDPREAKALFANVTDAKTRDEIIDEMDENRGRLTVRAIVEWEEAGFPGTWEDWWTRSYRKHLDDHKEYMLWMLADSGLDFWDWQKQQQERAREASPPPMPPPTMRGMERLLDDFFSADWARVREAEAELESYQIWSLFAILQHVRFLDGDPSVPLVIPPDQDPRPNYDVSRLRVRAGWCLEGITFRDFGFSGPHPSTEEATSRAKAWLVREGRTWTRYEGLLDALRCENPARQARALDWLRSRRSRCDGLNATTFEREVRPIVRTLTRSRDEGVATLAIRLLARHP